LGKNKINNEIKFYKNIIENNIELSIPKLIHYGDGIIILEFIKNSLTLTNVINEYNINYYYETIKKYLEKLHENKIMISQEMLYNDLIIEIKNKNINRFKEYNWHKNNDFKKIKTVNFITIKDIEYYINKIYDKLVNYLGERNYYNLIHGDTHLGNILLYENKLYFIDPRGYFGNTELYGLREYD